MPHRNGVDVLADLNPDPGTGSIPVVMVSSMILQDAERNGLERAETIPRKQDLSPEHVRSVLVRACTPPS